MDNNLLEKHSIIKQIEQNKVFAVVRCDCHQRAIDISKALIEGGLRNIEITTSCKNAGMAIDEISQIEGVSVAAGSIITNHQAEEAVKAGAKLIVSPVLEMNLVKFSKGAKTPLITGASTANEAYEAWKLGVSITKIFPVSALGGPEYVKDILKPMPFLRLMPTSGVQMNDFTEYLKAGAIAVGMGKCLYRDENNLSLITKKAEEVVLRLNEYIDSSKS